MNGAFLSVAARRRASMVPLASWALWALAFWMPAAAQPRPPAGPGWQRCAGQDEICRFQGQALVRYGAAGRYAYKVGTHRLICDHYEFGDPAFGQPKQCDFNPDLNARPGVGDAGGPWTFCASEGDTCRFSGSARVRYGADQRYQYRDATGSIRCSVDVFGDPAYGKPKRCEYQLQRPGVGGGISNDPGWEYCASEGGTCRFSGAGEVRYGAKGRFVTRRAVNSMACSVAAFGSDPVFGEPKHCYVRQARLP